MKEQSEFLKEITYLLHKQSKEHTISNMPDYVLAIYLKACLEAYNEMVLLRDELCKKIATIK